MFLLRLIAEHGLAGAARVLRALAEELEALCSHLGPVRPVGAGASKMNQVVAFDRGAGQ